MTGWLLLSPALFVAAIALVQRRILIERFAWLWLIPCGALVARIEPSPALLAVIGLCLYVSIRVSRLTLITKNLVQETALAKEELEHRGGRRGA